MKILLQGFALLTITTLLSGAALAYEKNAANNDLFPELSDTTATAGLVRCHIMVNTRREVIWASDEIVLKATCKCDDGKKYDVTGATKKALRSACEAYAH